MTDKEKNEEITRLRFRREAEEKERNQLTTGVIIVTIVIIISILVIIS